MHFDNVLLYALAYSVLKLGAGGWQLAFFLKLFFAQFVVAMGVVFVLKNKLDKILIENALRSLKYWQKDETTPKNVQMTVVSHKKLNQKYRAIIMEHMKKQCGDAFQADYQIDRSMMGGIIIKIGERNIQFSLKEKLKVALGS